MTPAEKDSADTVDVADRIATALMAIVRGDDNGAATLLDSVKLETAQKFFGALLTLTAHYGCVAMGPDGFVAELAAWRDAIASLPPDWWEKAKNAQQN